MIYLGNSLVDIKSPIGPLEEKEVNFYDWDGKLLYSYTKTEFLASTDMPALPDRTSDNLTCEGWNMTIADIATRFNKGFHHVSVGCTYHTTDSKTHIIVKPNTDRPTAYLYIKPTIANDTVVNWGDGSSDTISSTSTTQLSHTYSSNIFESEVDLTIESTNGLHIFTSYIGYSSDNNKSNNFIKIFLSSNSRIGGSNIFYNLYYLESITIHKDIIKDTTLPNATMWFAYCVSLKHLNTPPIVIGRGILQYCSSVKRASIPYLQSGYVAFQYCSHLEKCEVLFNRGTTSSDHTGMGSMYGYNTALKHVYIDERITTTDTNCFTVCYNVEEVILPSTLTSVSNNIFTKCVKLKNIYIKATSVPTLSSALTAPNDFYKIYVPRNSYSSYITASNWSDIASHIYPYDFN